METIKGLKKLLKDLDNFGEEADKGIEAITQANAQEIEVKAKQLAPVDLGKLRQSINTTKVADKHYKVSANAPYAAYMEFGTGGLVNVPSELSDIAIKFKGRGIKQVNIAPRPFLWPAFINQRGQYLQDLRDLLNKLSKRV